MVMSIPESLFIEIRDKCYDLIIRITTVVTIIRMFRTMFYFEGIIGDDDRYIEES